MKLKRGRAVVEVKRSLFCMVRNPQQQPMCRFYTASTVAALELFGLPATATIERCLAVDGSLCVLAVDLTEGRAGVGPREQTINSPAEESESASAAGRASGGGAPRALAK